MKPKKIFLVRHGQSQGNVDSAMYSHTPDYKLLLTELGKEQAVQAGYTLKNIIGNESIQFYISPLWRTRDTFKGLLTALKDNEFKYLEDPRIREQEWGHLKSVEESARVNKERDEYGTFYYRIPDGESGADVYDRVSTFMESMHRDFKKPDFPENVVIVSHGLAIRLFLMKWFHWTVEEFSQMKNPYNCQIFELLKNEKDKYDLITKIIPHSEPDIHANPLIIR